MAGHLWEATPSRVTYSMNLAPRVLDAYNVPRVERIGGHPDDCVRVCACCLRMRARVLFRFDCWTQSVPPCFVNLPPRKWTVN